MRRRFDVFWDSLFRKYKEKEEIENHLASLELTTYRVKKAKKLTPLLLCLLNQDIEDKRKDIVANRRSTLNIFTYHSKFVNNLFQCLVNHNKYLQQGNMKEIRILRALFHGTTTAFLPNILKEGLQPSKQGQCWKEDRNKKPRKVCLTDSLYVAEFFALVAAQEFGGEAIVLKINVKGFEEKMRIAPGILVEDDNTATVFWRYFEFFFTEPIPPDRIKKWYVLPKPSAFDSLTYWIYSNNLPESSKEEKQCRL